MKTADLRVCMFCEFIFKLSKQSYCPICSFGISGGTYGAYYVYGKKAYKYYKTQEPFKIKKIAEFESKLDKIIYGVTK